MENYNIAIYRWYLICNVPTFWVWHFMMAQKQYTWVKTIVWTFLRVVSANLPSLWCCATPPSYTFLLDTKSWRETTDSVQCIMYPDLLEVKNEYISNRIMSKSFFSCKLILMFWAHLIGSLSKAIIFGFKDNK